MTAGDSTDGTPPLLSRPVVASATEHRLLRSNRVTTVPRWCLASLPRFNPGKGIHAYLGSGFLNRGLSASARVVSARRAYRHETIVRWVALSDSFRLLLFDCFSPVPLQPLRRDRRLAPIPLKRKIAFNCKPRYAPRYWRAAGVIFSDNVFFPRTTTISTSWPIFNASIA